MRMHGDILMEKVRFYCKTFDFFDIRQDFDNVPEIYIQSAPNNSNETYTFIAVLGSAKTASKFNCEIQIG